MKRKQFWLWSLTFLPLVITLVSFIFMPEKVPAHYGFDGHVTRYGSKYELLIFPASTILLSLFLFFIRKREQRKNDLKNDKILTVSHFCILVLFLIETIYFLTTSLFQINSLYETSVDFFNLLALILSLFLIIIGNYIPKCKPNVLIGIRTTWTLKSETVWYKTHRLGGWLSVLAGIILLFINLFILKGELSLVSVILTLLSLTSILTFYSYQQYKKETTK